MTPADLAEFRRRAADWSLGPGEARNDVEVLCDEVEVLQAENVRLQEQNRRSYSLGYREGRKVTATAPYPMFEGGHYGDHL